ncbi:putative SOS response-associated peptidase YedK [Desulfallas thermosapovorans DSM 6562]|uniref:Abasic site processing protein n=2 Tax=Desulfallas thermosapovorans TaxID=58137 RepID=A0A5S4ZRS2_9FIRM|nr:SOS response-associated peptidase [Desulfallas thermosapovorans]TYO95356.1 putative SOS response-associated peptidase YedK [Desulfallas thermosapovorans DSM 6562]
MCGRFTLSVELSTILRVFQVQYKKESFIYSKRYNIAPGQNVPVITGPVDHRVISLMRWGLVPHWAKEVSTGNKLINARAETIDQKPAFKSSFIKRRCLVPADGFYEWKKQAGGKTPVRIILPDKEVFAFAGIWAQWQSPEGNITRSCAIITTGPNDFMRSIHNRMPVVLSGESACQIWLESNDVVELKELLQPYGGLMMAYQVSSMVNSPEHDHPKLLEKYS